MSEPLTCPQCGHSADSHWPRHERGTSACVICLDAQTETYRIGPSNIAKAICCYPVADMERAANVP